MWTLDELESPAGVPTGALLPADRALPNLAAVHLDATASERLRHGQAVRTTATAAPGRVRIYDDAGRFAGLGELDQQGVLRPSRLLVLPA